MLACKLTPTACQVDLCQRGRDSILCLCGSPILVTDSRPCTLSTDLWLLCRECQSVCVSIHVCIHTYIYIYVYKITHAGYTYIWIYVYTYMSMYRHTCIHTWVILKGNIYVREEKALPSCLSYRPSCHSLWGRHFRYFTSKQCNCMSTDSVKITGLMGWCNLKLSFSPNFWCEEGAALVA